MADFPSAIFSPRSVANLSGISYDATKSTVDFAEDYSLPAAEIVAIETALGTNPEGGSASVGARIALIEGTQIPNAQAAAEYYTDVQIAAALAGAVRKNIIYSPNADVDLQSLGTPSGANIYIVTSSGNTVTMPSSPTVGDFFDIHSSKNSTGVLTVNFNGLNSEGGSTASIVAGGFCRFVFFDGGAGDLEWARMMNQGIT
jgi:hypothetical protein